MKPKKNKAIERKPDFENESFRAWIPDEKEKGKWKKDFEDEELKVDIGDGRTIGLCGFTKVHKDGKLLLAYKIKAIDQQVLYYIPNDLSEEDNLIILKSMEDLKNIIPFSFRDIRGIAKDIMDREGNTMDRLTDMKKRGEKNEVEDEEND